MKKMIFSLFCALGMISMPTAAQTQPQASDTVSVNEAVPEHMMFEGVPMGITIDEFTERLKPRFQLKRKMGGDRNFIYQGYIFGHETYFQASYTRKSRIVYKVLVTPKNIDDVVWLDSLSHRYGEPVLTDKGYLWQRPEGMVLYYVPQGYETALFYVDSKGNAIFKEEE